MSDCGTDRSGGLHGAGAATIRRALAAGDPLPGTRGFAGRIPAVGLVRDVLGRYPVFSERNDYSRWSFDPTDLTDPDPVPAGHIRRPGGDEHAWTLPDPIPLKDEEAVRRVRAAVVASLDEVPVRDTSGDDGGPGQVAEGETMSEKIAVAFSGGVDSATLAARLHGPLYVTGFPDSHDLKAARTAADLMGRNLRVVELTHADLERAVPAVVRATGRTNAMDVAIATTLYLAAEQAAADGYDRLAVGQGADELFGGYAKVAKAPEDSRVEANTVRGATREVVGSLPEQLERDVLALRAAGVEPVAPLLDDRVVRAALALPKRLLVDDGERKRAFRLAVREFLPEELADREKKAAQYGSLVARELDRLARQAGFKRRMDDHVTRYVETLV